jgi:hypothetical protein
MTMLSPLGRVPKQRPPAPRRTRRVLPAALLMLVLALIAMVVWWKVIKDSSDPTNTAGSCQTKPTVDALKLAPKSVKIRVYNATEKAGLAKGVADALHKKGFVISTTGNDPLASSRDVAGVGELRYGPTGANQALLISLYLPGVKLSEDPRTDAVVDFAIGPEYKSLANTAQFNAARAKAALLAKAGDPPVGC